MEYNHIAFYKRVFFMTNDAFIDVFVKGIDSVAVAIVEFKLRSVGDMGDQLAFRIRSIRSSNDLFGF